MNRIVFISPYKDLSDVAQSVAEELGIAVEFHYGWLEQAAQIVDGLKGPPIDIIVSRGGNADHLAQKFPMIPVVRVNTGPYDIIEALDEARRHTRNIAIVAFGNPFVGIGLLEKVMDVNITEIVWSHLQELEEEIIALSHSGQYCVVGGGPAVSYASKYGLPSVFLRTNRETLHEAFLQVDQLAKLRKEETRKTFRLKAILDAAYEGIIAVNNEGVIEIFNKSAERILKIASKDAIGRDVAEVIPNTRFNDVVRTGQIEIGEIIDVGEIRIITNRVPIKSGNELMGSVASFQESSKLVQAEWKFRKAAARKSQFQAKVRFSDIVGSSDVIDMKKKIAKRFAESDLTVLIYGASGTGKEMFAQSIHNAGPRSSQPFVAVNCGAIPPTLFESELFGYEEGAFTGARRKGKYGLFELAHGGTLFLDEIDAVPLDMQGRLLRVLQEREVLRIGGEGIIPVNVRVIAATNKSPKELLENHRIREDLFYRLNVLFLELPALSEHREDIGLLCEHFLSSVDKQQILPLLRKLLPYFENNSWPGNVRELGNIVQRLSFFADSFKPGQDIRDFLRIVAPNILLDDNVSADHTAKLRRRIKGVEDELILKALKEQGTLDRAAAYLGIGRSTLTHKLKIIRGKQSHF